jgi:hypothetical protein
MWALNIMLYCSSDLQAFLKGFEDPAKKPVTKDDLELNAFLMQLLWKRIENTKTSGHAVLPLVMFP